MQSQIIEIGGITQKCVEQIPDGFFYIVLGNAANINMVTLKDCLSDWILEGGKKWSSCMNGIVWIVHDDVTLHTITYVMGFLFIFKF